MSREGLLPQLQARGIQVKEMKYGQQSVSVYQGIFQSSPVAIKVLSLAAGADHTCLEKECNTLMSLSHPNILRLYDCFWENNRVSYFFVIVIEWCEKDLAKEMRQRADNQFPWREDELWKLTFELVSALAYMQKQGISHRDIKPESIFMTFTKETKLGDLGSARTFLSDINCSTLAGTPFYLSPKLKEAFMNRTPQVVHNSFKSDVYSLGLALLSLIFLAQPMSLMKANLSNEEVQAVITTVPCSDLFKSMLTWMLSVDEDTRCDFQMLNDWLHRDSLSLNKTSSIMQQETANAAIEPSQEAESIEANRMDKLLIESYSPEISSPNRTRDTLCLQCGKALNRSSDTALCEVVQLLCGPDKCTFCCKACCRIFLSQDIFKCPQCGVQIPAGTIDQPGFAEKDREARKEEIKCHDSGPSETLCPEDSHLIKDEKSSIKLEAETSAVEPCLKDDDQISFYGDVPLKEESSQGLLPSLFASMSRLHR